MNAGRARVSLTELRRKTDRQILALIRGEMEKCLRLARRNAIIEAEARYAMARNLLAVATAAPAERAELEARLREVRAALDCPGAMTCAHSACC